METKICNTCNRELPLSDFSLTRLGNRMAVCRDCVNEKRAQTRYNHAPVGGVKMPPFSDPDFDGKDQGECHHCLGGIYCEAHIVEIKDSEAVDYCYGICSDLQS